jgi:hypothetical protein
MIVNGTITRLIDGREVKIDFVVNGESYTQWGQDTHTLGHNVDLVERLRDAVWEEVNAELSDPRTASEHRGVSW